MLLQVRSTMLLQVTLSLHSILLLLPNKQQKTKPTNLSRKREIFKKDTFRTK